ncbi:MAG: M28 family peptidase [bacterium]
MIALRRRANRLAVVVAAALACHAPTPREPLPAGVGADIAYLADPARQGRGVGSPGSAAAARFIVSRYRALALDGAFAEECAAPQVCPSTFFQPFMAEGTTARNIVAVIHGADSLLAGEYVLVGAHYDHLGVSPAFSNDQNLGVAVRPGADDNASGTAAVLELARRLAERPAARSILLVNFDAEEFGMLGSALFVRYPPAALDSIVLMLNLDMVGRLRRRDLLIDGSGANDALRAMADSVAKSNAVRSVRWSGSIGRSDHASFAAMHVPTIMLTSGEHTDYHRVTDLAARIDVKGLLRIVDVAEGIIRTVGARGWMPPATTQAAP